MDSSSVLNTGLTSIPLGISAVREPSQAEKDLENAFYEKGLYREHTKYSECGKKVIPYKCLTCELEFYMPVHCDLRICPKCAGRLAARFRTRYVPIFQRYLGKKGKDRLMLLTLTTINHGEMPSNAAIRAHNRAIGKLIRELFKGGVAVNEVKDTFLHSHAVVYGPYVPKAKISKRWDELTGCRVIWISVIKGGARSVANYISKYINKPYPYEKTPEGFSKAVSFLQAFKRIRRIHSFGCFYAAPKKLEPHEFECPYCGSTCVFVDSAKHQLAWTLQDCRIRGMPSYQDVRNTWNNTTLAQARA